MNETRVGGTNRIGLVVAVSAAAVVTFVIAASEWSRRSHSTPSVATPEVQPIKEPAASTEVKPATHSAAEIKPSVAKAAPPGPTPKGMVWIPGGVYWRGSDSPSHLDSRPWHAVEVAGFWLDEAPVTNEEFAKFVEATKYRTIAERTPTKEEFPNAAADNLVAGSVVFTPPTEPVPLDNHYVWWKYVKGADWRHPEGPESDLRGRENHPVVQVSYEDAVAYCKWSGKRLPTEAEFEFAARGGLDRRKYAWGDELLPGGRWMTNIWQGRFPIQNHREDGYRLTAPVRTYPKNGFGVYDVAGNVWQWCADWYRDDHYQTLSIKRQPIKDPQGPTASFDPNEPGVAKRVLRGGSFLCSDQYCTAYEVGVRGKAAPDTGTNHQGFRCAKSP